MFRKLFQITWCVSWRWCRHRVLDNSRMWHCSSCQALLVRIKRSKKDWEEFSCTGFQRMAIYQFADGLVWTMYMFSRIGNCCPRANISIWINFEWNLLRQALQCVIVVKLSSRNNHGGQYFNTCVIFCTGWPKKCNIAISRLNLF